MSPIAKTITLVSLLFANAAQAQRVVPDILNGRSAGYLISASEDTLVRYRSCQPYRYNRNDQDSVRYTVRNRNGYKPGLVNSVGQMIFDFGVYDYIHPVGMDYIIVKNSGFGIADFNGAVIKPPVYSSLSPAGNGYYIFQLNKYGKLGIAPKEYDLCNFKYKTLYPSQVEGRLIAGEIQNGEEQFGIIDLDDQIVVPFTWDACARIINTGYVHVSKNGKHEILSLQTGMTMHSMSWDSIQSLVQDSLFGHLYWVQDNSSRWGLINLEKGMVIEPKYDRPGSPFVNGVSRMNDSGKYGLLNKEGKWLVPPVYKWIEHPTGKIKDLYFERAGVQGYFDSTFNEVPYALAKGVIPDWKVSDAPAQLRKDLGHLFLIDSIVHHPTLREHLDMSMSYLYLKAGNSRSAAKIRYGYLFQELIEDMRFGLDVNPYYKRYVTSVSSETSRKCYYYNKEKILNLLGSEKLRQLTWFWVKPALKSCLKAMHVVERKKYQEEMSKLRTYMQNYKPEKVQEHLRENPNAFASHRWQDGKPSQDRSLEAMIDRLIYVHKVISYEDAERWITTIAVEMESW